MSMELVNECDFYDPSIPLHNYEEYEEEKKVWFRMTNVSWQSESAEKMHVINERILRYVELKPKLYIPSTLYIDLILWHTQLIVCALKC